VVAPGPTNGVNGTNSIVTVTIRWLPPSECQNPPTCSLSAPHVYSARATIGANQ
jgi:hypothetical protein